MSSRIVRTTYRYKRPPRKRKSNPAALAMPRIVTAKKPKPAGQAIRPSVYGELKRAEAPVPSVPRSLAHSAAPCGLLDE